MNVKKREYSLLIFFSLRISATPILVLTTESAILNTPTKGTDVFAHLATLEKTARKVNLSPRDYKEDRQGISHIHPIP